MKLKTKLTNPQLLTKILQVHEKANEQCHFRFSQKLMFFITKTEYQDGTQIWSRIKTKALFSDFRIESTMDNEIWVILDLKNILSALKTYSKAQSIIVKLSKKNGVAFLTLEITVNNANITQDIPLQVLGKDEVKDIEEPSLPLPTISITMPNLKDLKSIIDKMKGLNDRLMLTATLANTLNFSIESQFVNVSTFYKSLDHPITSQQSGSNRQPFQRDNETRAVAKVDIKKFWRFLFSHGLGTNEIICSIIEDRAVVMKITLDELDMHYYIPVLN
eukprot:gene3157-5473_t